MTGKNFKRRSLNMLKILKRSNSTMETNVIDSKQPAEPSRLTELPSELVHQICTYLDAQHLARLARTCRTLRNHAYDDSLWKTLLKTTLPPPDFPTNLEDATTYRDLFSTHHPYWFLPKHKIWFSDEKHTGQLVIAQYNKTRKCVEAYTVETRGRENGTGPGFAWKFNPSVWMHTFTFDAELIRTDPLLSFPNKRAAGRIKCPTPWWADGIENVASGAMSRHNRRQFTFEADWHNKSTFFFCKNAPENIPPKEDGVEDCVWPPRIIPAVPRVDLDDRSKPKFYKDLSQTSFKLSRRARPWTRTPIGRGPTNTLETTWSTLDPSLYTPTKSKPYQGIFVGDYSSHGCEFILIMQVDNPPPLPQRSGSSSYYDEAYIQTVDELSHTAAANDGAVKPNLDDNVAHSGALVGIKLTGDPNVRRGEYTIVAEDLGSAGLIRIAAEEPFRGARVVKSWGHVAEANFRNDEYIPTQLIMLNPNKLAMYWIAWDHIALYERVDIDALLAGK